MKHPFQIEIPKRTNHCNLGGEELLGGMEYVSALGEDAEGHLIRYDYCLKCWDSSAKDSCKKDESAYWKGKVLHKKEKKQLPKDRNERALALLKEALKHPDEDRKEEAFVLSLYLAHKRLIVLRQQVTQVDGIVQLYEVLETEEMLAVPKVDLAQLRVAAMQDTLAKKFKA